jgi:hypothetical protein
MMSFILVRFVPFVPHGIFGQRKEFFVETGTETVGFIEIMVIFVDLMPIIIHLFQREREEDGERDAHGYEDFDGRL